MTHVIKLKDKTLRAKIRFQYEHGVHIKKLAYDFGVHYSTIHRLLHGQTWTGNYAQKPPKSKSAKRNSFNYNLRLRHTTKSKAR